MRAPTPMHWLLAGLTVTFAGVVVDVWRTPPAARTLHEALQPFAQPRTIPSAQSGTATAPLQAAVLLQLNDCSGNLRMLHVLHRGAARQHLRLSVVWYAGPASDSMAIRAALPPWTATVPLRPATPQLLRQFATLGHTSTPAMLVADAEGRVRFATQSPRSSREVAGLRRIIEGLTYIEEL